MHIVVVDDDADARELTGEMLVRLGYDVQLCENGALALKFLGAKPFDLLLTDLAMPSMSGVQLIKKALDHDFLSKPQIVAVTGLEFNSDLVRWCTSEKIMLLFKPFDFLSLCWTLETLSEDLRYSKV